MRNTYKLLAEKYMNTISPEMDPALAEDDSLMAGAPGAGEQIESEGMEHADESLYELTHDYLISQNDEALTHYVNRAKDLDHLLHLAFEYTHEQLVDSNLTANDDSVDAEFSNDAVIEKLAKELHMFSHNTMPIDWLESKLNKTFNGGTHNEAGLPQDPEGVETGSTQEPEETTITAEKKKEQPKKVEKKPFAKNPYVAAIGDRWKGLSK